MSEILMCDKCKDVFSKKSNSSAVEVSFSSRDVYGHQRVVDKVYDLCTECTSSLLKEFEAPAALTADTTVRL